LALLALVIISSLALAATCRILVIVLRNFRLLLIHSW
jgi:hypothetical protein